MSNTDPATPPAQPRGAQRESSPLQKFLGGPPVAVAMRLVMLSLVVGVILSVIGLDPFNILESLGDFVRWVAYRFDAIIALGVDAVHWIVRYVLLGAAVVIPIWLLARLFKVGGR